MTPENCVLFKVMRGLLVTSYYWLLSLNRFGKSDVPAVLICSHGGVGTTFLSKFISRFRSTNDPYDRDHCKHLPRPPAWLHTSTKVVYVYGDPEAAAISLFRRNYAQLQSRKNGIFREISKDTDLSAYIKNGKDSLGLTKHVVRWLDKKYYCNPTVAVQYGSLWKNQADLVEFLDLPDAAVDDFPVQTTRRSNHDCISFSEQKRLSDIYSSYRKICSEMPGFAVIRK